MMNTPFAVTNSITKKLKSVMIAIAFFFIVSAFGIYLSSLGVLDGLQKINSANLIFNLTTQSIDALDSSNENLEKLLSLNKLRDIKYTFQANQRILKLAVQRSIDEANEGSKVKDQLQNGYNSILLYEESINNLFTKFTKLPRLKSLEDLEMVQSELLIANQFAIDAKDSFRKAQINLRLDSDKLFGSLYESRFTPLMVAMTLSAFFFLFVITFGFSIAKKIAESVTHLISATDRVSTGNLIDETTVLDNDEFGLLTDNFNKMVSSLREGRLDLGSTIDRLQSLQLITAAYSEATTTDQVLEMTIKIGFKAMGASAGMIGVLDGDRTTLLMKKSLNYSDEVMKKWGSISVQENTPMIDCIREMRPIFFENEKEVSQKYSKLKDIAIRNEDAPIAALPLIVGNICMGALYVRFNQRQDFEKAGKDFTVAISQQCAQALHRARLYDDAQTAIQVRDEFLSIASHELKTPLTPLKLQLQLLAKQFQKGTEVHPDKIMQIMQNSDRQLNRLSRLIEDLLDVSRITSGKLKLNLEEVDLNDLIKEVISQYGRQLKDSLKHVQIEAPTKVSTKIDQMRIEQVLVNLLTNAAKYAPGKAIKVSLYQVKDMAKITVRDQGPGISQENQERIFQRFERVKANDNIGGLGLGLYISHQIIEAHGGKIYVESEVGDGAEFIVELPIRV